jgi:hypothetical protein
VGAWEEVPETDEPEVEARLQAEGLPLEDHLAYLAKVDPHPGMELEEEEVEACLVVEDLPPLVLTGTTGTTNGSLIASYISISYLSGMGMARLS